LRPILARGFPAQRIDHQFVNRTDSDIINLEVGEPNPLPPATAAGFWGAPAAAEDHRTLVAANRSKIAAGSNNNEIAKMNHRRTS
jgi:hypothetical protein